MTRKLNSKKMSIEELNQKLDNKFFDKSKTAQIELLLEAINDWPNPVNSLGEFLKIDTG